jgi:ABC-type phosphate transport system substrate-binding protein
MKNRILALVTLTWLATASATAGDVYIVAQPSLTLSADEVRDAFLGDKQMAGGTRIVPLDNAAQQKDFLERVLKLDPAKYNAIWVKKGFRDGLNAPSVKTSDADVIAAVKANPGAIGYVSSPPKDLKVLGKY